MLHTKRLGAGAVILLMKLVSTSASHLGAFGWSDVASPFESATHYVYDGVNYVSKEAMEHAKDIAERMYGGILYASKQLAEHAKAMAEQGAAAIKKDAESVAKAKVIGEKIDKGVFEGAGGLEKALSQGAGAVEASALWGVKQAESGGALMEDVPGLTRALIKGVGYDLLPTHFILSSIANVGVAMESGLTKGLEEAGSGFLKAAKATGEGFEDIPDIQGPVNDALNDIQKEGKQLGFKLLTTMFGAPQHPGPPDFLHILKKPCAKMVHALLCKKPLVSAALSHQIHTILTHQGSEEVDHEAVLLNLDVANLLKKGVPNKYQTLKSYFESAAKGLKLDKAALHTDLKAGSFVKPVFPKYDPVPLGAMLLILQAAYRQDLGLHKTAPVSLKATCHYAEGLVSGAAAHTGKEEKVNSSTRGGQHPASTVGQERAGLTKAQILAVNSMSGGKKSLVHGLARDKEFVEKVIAYLHTKAQGPSGAAFIKKISQSVTHAVKEAEHKVVAVMHQLAQKGAELNMPGLGLTGKGSVDYVAQLRVPAAKIVASLLCHTNPLVAAMMRRKIALTLSGLEGGMAQLGQIDRAFKGFVYTGGIPEQTLQKFFRDLTKLKVSTTYLTYDIQHKQNYDIFTYNTANLSVLVLILEANYIQDRAAHTGHVSYDVSMDDLCHYAHAILSKEKGE